MSTINQRVINRARSKYGLRIYTRSQWGSRYASVYETRRRTKPALQPADTVWQHITVTLDHGDLTGDFFADVRTVERIGYERFKTGCSYNWIVDMVTGDIAEGQPLDAKGSHTVNDKGVPNFSRDQNYAGRAIAVLGMPDDELSPKAARSIAGLMAAMMDEKAITTHFDYMPHSHVAEKDCPCDSTRNQMRAIKAKAHELRRPLVVRLWKTAIDKLLGGGSITLQTATANVCELPRHDKTIAATFKAAATGCQLVGFQETGNEVYVKAARTALPNHQIHGLEGDGQHNVSMGFDKKLFRHVASGYRKHFDGESGISHTRNILWVELELIADPRKHIIAVTAHYPAGAFSPSGAQRTSGDRIPKRVEMWRQANSNLIKLLTELAAKGHPMVVFADVNRQKVKALPDVLAGRKTHAVSNALDWTFYIDGDRETWTTHEVVKVDINSPGHPALQNRATLRFPR